MAALHLHSYVTARIFGIGPDEEMMVQARAWVSSESANKQLALQPLPSTFT